MNMVDKLSRTIYGRGGFFNAHGHFDRAYTLGDDMAPAYKTLKAKWKYVDRVKRQSSEEDYYRRFLKVIDEQLGFGVTHCVSFVDVDEVCEDRALRAGVRAREYAAERGMTLLLACQTLKGVLRGPARAWFERAIEDVDIIGGLPAADPGLEDKHIEVLLRASRETGKPVHVHVDQLDTPDEMETELLAHLTMKHGCEGRVAAVHGISIGAHDKPYREEVYQKCVDAGLAFISCPTAWIDRRRREDHAPVHNSVTPVDEIIPHGIPVYIGSDNICDVYKPYANGDMLVELRVLLESTHFYDFDKLIEIATWPGDDCPYFGSVS